MKKIIDGVTYNPDTSTAIGRSEIDADDAQDGKQHEMTLYRTRGGAFFEVDHITWGVQDMGQWEQREKYEFTPKTENEAREWMLKGEVEVVNEVFGEPPEAEAETAPSATIYFRLPDILKTQIERKAKAENLSVNAWLLRCAESCVRQGEKLHMIAVG